VKYRNIAIRSVARSQSCQYQTLRTFSNDTSDSDENRGQQEGENKDNDRTYETSSSSSEPHLLTPENLNELVRGVNLSKNKLKTSLTLRFQTKSVESSPPR